MEWIIRLTALAVIACLMAVTLEKTTPGIGLLLSLATVVMLLLVSVSILEPILSFLRKLEHVCGVSAVYAGTMLKCVCICLITRFGAAFCKDAGQSGMASALELGGVLASVWVSLPLLEAFLSMLEELI